MCYAINAHMITCLYENKRKMAQIGPFVVYFLSCFVENSTLTQKKRPVVVLGGNTTGEPRLGVCGGSPGYCIPLVACAEISQT